MTEHTEPVVVATKPDAPHVAAAKSLNGSGRDSAGENIALLELWNGGINGAVLYAATNVQ
ncbi:MAG: hypothetical protein EBS32_12885 [Actinobacteria bacterium]|nr:hypothetical protein [Actinomycetota bacterium]